METSSDFRHGRHCITNIHIHLVFVTKYRKCVFTPEILSTMKSVFSKICEDFEAVLVQCDGERDHVHLLINYPPKVSISKLVNSLKGASSRRLRRIHPELKACYWKSVLWSPSYFAASCGGAPISIIRQYIEDQAKH
jgi:putative transposase